MPNIATKWILFGGAFIIATAGKSKELEINGQIRDREVRLIGADGEQKGVVSIQVAMRAAEDAGLDLVKIAPQAVPPVCKVLDYGKYRFEQQKKEKEAKKNQKVVEVKETRLSLNIDTNDFNTKLNQTAKFLAAGHKVKASIRSQVRTVFFLPLVTAACHLAAAYPMLKKLLALVALYNGTLFAWCLAGTVLVFGLIYLAVFAVTSRSYYKIVGNQV